MKLNQFVNRAKLLILEGIKVGLFVSLLLSLLYDGLASITIWFGMPGAIPEIGSITINFLLDTAGTIFLVAGILFIVGVFPALIIGGLGGGIIGLVLALFEEKFSESWARAVGFAAGSIIILITNILPWQLSNPFYGNISFTTYLLGPIILTLKNVKFSMVYLFYFPYFVPNIIAILISPYIGWKINNTKKPKHIEQQLIPY